MPKTIAAIPAYNESSRIKPVILKAKKYVDEVIVVDDHSRDNTLQVAKEAGATAVRLVTNMGAGFATRTACDIAAERGADFIVTLDSDGQHDPEEIPQMVKPLTKGFDVVFGCRPRDDKMPAVKRLGNWGLTVISKILFGINKLYVGGAERLVLLQLAHIDKSRFEPHLVTLLTSILSV